MDASDATLFSQWTAGDPDAGEALFHRHFAAIYRFFRGKLDETDATEATQETFLGCVAARDSFRGECSFRTFLFAIARKKLLLHLRRRTRKEGKWDFTELSLADLGPSPTSVLDADREERRLALALTRIPVELQLMIEMHYWEELGVSDIAIICEIPVGTVKSRLRRARTLLLEALATIDPRDAARTTLETLERRVADLRNALPRTEE